jgi:hypothetical protein
MMLRQALRALLTISMLLGALSSAHAASYTFTTLDVPDVFATFAFKLNNAGQVVGVYVENNPDLTNHGFLYAGSTFTTLDAPLPRYVRHRSSGDQ